MIAKLISESNILEDDIDFSDSPPITEERAQKGWVRLQDGTRIVPVRMDPATFHWYQSQGKDFSARLEEALLTFANSHR